ncbi:unnamed protein product, partial [Symbiodinium sp. KB8]
VIPLGPMQMAGPEAVPEVVKDKYSKFWWVIAVLLVTLAVSEIVTHDVFAVLFHSLLAGITIFLVKDSCKNMSMYCLLMVGLMCSLQAFFETLALLGSLGGRRSTSTIVAPGSRDNVTTYTTQVTTHPFFDKSQGVVYNAQSALLIASPVVMVLAAVLAYYTYNEFSSPLFPDDDAETGGVWGGGQMGYGTYGGGATNYGDATRRSQKFRERQELRVPVCSQFARADGGAAQAVMSGPDPEQTPNDQEEVTVQNKADVDVETLREAVEAYLKLTRPESKGSKGDLSDSQAAEGDDEPHEAKHLLKLFRTMIDPKKDVLTQLLKKLEDKLFVDEEVLCLAMRSASAAVTARLWERTVTAIEQNPGPGRFLDGEIPETPKACESATDTSSAVHAMVILMCPIKKRREFYRHLVEYDWEAVCGAFCYMFLSPHCGPPETLKRICDCLLFLDAEASSKVELDVETAEEMHQMNAKLQQTAVAMVEYLRDYEQEELWYSEVGAEILADFQFVDARLFFFRPRLQRILCDMWHPKYDHVSDWEYMCYVLKFHAGNIMGLILLIPCALCPSLESYVYNRKISMEREIRKYSSSAYGGLEFPHVLLRHVLLRQALMSHPSRGKRDADRQKIEKEVSKGPPSGRKVMEESLDAHST